VRKWLTERTGLQRLVLPSSEARVAAAVRSGVRYQVPTETIIFVRNAEGRVTHYIRRLRGQDSIVKKVN